MSDAPSTSNSLIEALNDHFLTQINNINDNILDLIITNVPEYVNITDLKTPTNAVAFTDHFIVHYLSPLQRF